jgi:uncharacterized protein
VSKAWRAPALLLVALLWFCAQKQSTAPPPPPLAPAAAPQSTPAVVFPDGFRVACEIAADDATRTQGLMYRESIAPGKGMLFIFSSPGVYPFWMKNTLIPLDIIWINDASRVVFISAKTPLCAADPCPTYPPSGVARMVLEIGAGQAAAHHLRPGDAVVLEHPENFVPR